MALLDDLQFNTTHWQLAETRARERVWVNGQGDTLRLLLGHGPLGIPVVGAAQAFGEQLWMALDPAWDDIRKSWMISGIRCSFVFVS
jgi:hypothetical protein